MTDKRKPLKKETNVTQAQIKIISERKKRLGDALRENLKRRKAKVTKGKNNVPR